MATDTDAKSVHNSVGSNLAEGFAVLAVALTNGG